MYTYHWHLFVPMVSINGGGYITELLELRMEPERIICKYKEAVYHESFLWLISIMLTM